MNATTDANKALYREFIQEVFNAGRVERVSEYLAPDYRLRDAPPGAPNGPDAVVQIVRMFRAAFPDLHVAIEEQVAEGDWVASRSVTRGTHRGVIFGVQPSGRSITMPGLTMVKIAGGRITESSVKNDMLVLLKQIGAAAIP